MNVTYNKEIRILKEKANELREYVKVLEAKISELKQEMEVDG